MGITIEKHVFKLNYFITIFFKKIIIRYGNSITFYLKACLNIACCMLCAGGDGGGGWVWGWRQPNKQTKVHLDSHCFTNCKYYIIPLHHIPQDYPPQWLLFIL